MSDLVERLEKGEVKGIILYNVNPAYDYPQAERFIKALAKTNLSISLSETLDETASFVNYVCPDNHYLESWNDAEPEKGSFSFCQPAINKIFDTRQAQDSLLVWGGLLSTDDVKQGANADQQSTYLTYIQKYWEDKIYPLQTEFHSFQSFWTNILQKGVYKLQEGHSLQTSASNLNTNQSQQPAFLLADNDFNKIVSSISSVKTESFEYVLYENIGIGNGKHANNPWLQELPDPI